MGVKQSIVKDGRNIHLDARRAGQMYRHWLVLTSHHLVKERLHCGSLYESMCSDIVIGLTVYLERSDSPPPFVHPPPPQRGGNDHLAHEQ